MSTTNTLFAWPEKRFRDWFRFHNTEVEKVRTLKPNEVTSNLTKSTYIIELICLAYRNTSFE